MFADDLARFISASPTSYHAAAEVASRLEKAGFTKQVETDEWDASPGGHYIVRDGAVLAWYVPENVSTPRFTILGTHTDSPGLKVKPTAMTSTFGYSQVNIETYGGLLATSWLNRDLEVAGRVTTASGTHLVRTGPVMVVPQLAIHLARDSKVKVEINPQTHLHPIFSTGEATLDLGIDEEILGWDLFAFDTQEPATFGPNNDFFAAPRQDNLLSVHAGLIALENMTTWGDSVAVFAAFDHEEIGSGTATGAAGPILETVLRRTAGALGATSEEDVQRAFAASVCLSADCGHAIHPNYGEKHDPDHQVRLGDGVLIKHNANQAYTTDGPGTAFVRKLAKSAGAKLQDFVSRNDSPCGSTIGPLTATRLGIHTIDIGAPLWSMHSVREISSPADHAELVKLITAFWTEEPLWS